MFASFRSFQVLEQVGSFRFATESIPIYRSIALFRFDIIAIATKGVCIIPTVQLSPVRMGPLGKTPALPSTSAPQEPMRSHLSTLRTPGIHNKSVVVCNLYCDRSNDKQVSSGWNLKGLDKLIIIMIYTKHNHNNMFSKQSSLKSKHGQNIGGDKILVATKYWCQQNIGVKKILASTKYWRRQIVRIDKILASTKYWRWQNIGTDIILESTESRRPQNVGACA